VDLRQRRAKRRKRLATKPENVSLLIRGKEGTGAGFFGAGKAPNGRKLEKPESLKRRKGPTTLAEGRDYGVPVKDFNAKGGPERGGPKLPFL